MVPVGGAALLQGRLAGRDHQCGGQGWGTGPADYPAAPCVQDCRQIQPAFAGLQVGDIGHPDLIGCARSVGRLDQIGDHGATMPAVGGARFAPMLLFAPHPELLHQASAPAATDSRTGLTQVLDDPGRPVVAPTLPMEPGDLDLEDLVLALSLARTRCLPPVVSAAGDSEQFTEQADGMFALHRFDPGIPLSGVSERMPNDFFNTISRSRSRSTSARNRRLSSSTCSIVRSGLAWTSPEGLGA